MAKDTPRTNRQWNIQGPENAEAAWKWAEDMERESEKHLAMLRACRAKFGDAAVNEAIFEHGRQSLHA